jgi:hypothetical protein
MNLNSILLIAMMLGAGTDAACASPPRTPADFASEQRASTWLSAVQIDRNPYLWQGKRVGVVLRLQRMIDPENALVRQLGDDVGPAFVLGNVAPETFRQTAVIAVVEIDAERTPLRGYEQPLSSATLVATFPCAETECYNWLNDSIAWGQPLSGQ